MHSQTEFDWRSIGALNTVSTLAQVGQFGIAFVVLPVWLVEQGLNASQLGMFAASLWLGQLPGLGFAPWLCKRFGDKQVILAGLFSTLLALTCAALVGWPYWLIAGALAGFGLGLRWIALEPWLYLIAPAHARGRLVGFHETLIALAPIVAPLLAAYFGIHGKAIFWIGAGFTLAAIVPLCLARSATIQTHQPGTSVSGTSTGGARMRAAIAQIFRQPRDHIFKQGIVIALLGGMSEAALSGLFAIFAQERGYAVLQITDLLALFGVGGLLLQYPVGWLTDHTSLGTAAISCALGTVLVALCMSLPLAYLPMQVAVFLLGGFITAFLTMALIASTTTGSGDMAQNVSLLSMLYTLSAVAGPLIAGLVMQTSHADALMWLIALAALSMASILALYGRNSRTRLPA
ncbi:MFS transporter [Undibacterium sp.]|uniref:MFS transporter n=1 Tax=Undibacterium sp. TaxID=1914977 RepID=UPI0025D77490|nr:MFS transporter [Undibacterium sp.]